MQDLGTIKKLIAQIYLSDKKVPNFLKVRILSV